MTKFFYRCNRCGEDMNIYYDSYLLRRALFDHLYSSHYNEGIKEKDMKKYTFSYFTQVYIKE
jgi:hypothetical protein